MTTLEWEKLLTAKFESQVGQKSTLIASWLHTAISGVDQKGDRYFRRAQFLFKNIETSRILDAGCGDGSIALRFAIAGADVVGLDKDCEFVDIARIRAREMYSKTPVLFLCADLCSCNEFMCTDFDLIISVDVIEHVADATKYLKNLKEVLSNGGKIWLFTPNRFGFKNILNDPHYHLRFLTLIPNKWAEYYAINIKRVTTKYEVEQLFTCRLLNKIADECGYKIDFQTKKDFDQSLKNRRWFSFFARISLIRRILYFFYKYRVTTIEAILS